VNTAINASATFTDPGILETHTAVWNWGDGASSLGVVTEVNGSGSVTGSHTYTAPGVYTITLTVTDKDGGQGLAEYEFVVLYNPGAGGVAGKGFINSPAGAYTPNPSVTGKAYFGFVSKYSKGATVPTGQTALQFAVGKKPFYFSSNGYQWLVVNGAMALFQGSGTVNGTGNYGFILSVIDGQAKNGGRVDKFRIKIWDKGTGNIVYDNQVGAPDYVAPSMAISCGTIAIVK
jgi:hypothetical protein